MSAAMNIFVFGMSHKTAPISLREKFIITKERNQELRDLLPLNGIVKEKVILSTCNRTEFYGVGENPDLIAQTLLSHLSSYVKIPSSQLRKQFYLLRQPDSVSHLFKVAAGLDSMALGETEILGQVKNAYLQAFERAETGSSLNVLFQKSLRVGKKVRAQTDIGVGHVSVASIALDLAQKIFERLQEKRILLLGSGEVAHLFCETLTSRGKHDFHIVNRRFERAQELALTFGGHAAPMGHLLEEAVTSDIMITSMASSGGIITERDVRKWMQRKRGRPIFIIDLAVPRNIEERVGMIEDVYLYNIDDLTALADENLKSRKNSASACHTIISDAVERFMRKVYV